MRQIIKILGNKKIGFFLAFACVLGLIIGSTVMNFNADIYPPFFPFELNFFFQPVRAVHGWLYFLLFIFSVFGINISFSTLDTSLDYLEFRKKFQVQVRESEGSGISLVPLIKRKQRMLSAILVHLSLVLMLFAHLIEGFYSSSERIVIGQPDSMGRKDRDIKGIGRVSVKDLRQIHYQDGSLKDMIIQLETLTRDKRLIKNQISYNNPATFNWGMDEIILQNGEKVYSGLVLKDDANQEYLLQPRKFVNLKNGKLRLTGIFDMERGWKIAEVNFYASAKNSEDLSRQKPSQTFFVAVNPEVQSHKSFTVNGVNYTLLRPLEDFFLLALARNNPSIPLSALAAILMTIGIIFMITGNRKKV